jgi:hypothetical protein
MGGDVTKKIKSELTSLTSKRNILLVDTGTTALGEIMQLALKLGKEKILVQDQGARSTYEQVARKYGLLTVPLRTDYGLTDLEHLEQKADGKSMYIVNSLPGFYAEENMSKVVSVCTKKHCLVITDITGTIGTKKGTYGDILFTSFNQYEPIDVGKGGALFFGEHLPLHAEIIPGTEKLLRHFFPVPEYFEHVNEHKFNDTQLKNVLEHVKNVKSRQKKLRKSHWSIKKDLKDHSILHPKRGGINVIVSYQNDEEKNTIIKYCEGHTFVYALCPRPSRVDAQAISIEVR